MGLLNDIRAYVDMKPVLLDDLKKHFQGASDDDKWTALVFTLGICEGWRMKYSTLGQKMRELQEVARTVAKPVKQ